MSSFRESFTSPRYFIFLIFASLLFSLNAFSQSDSNCRGTDELNMLGDLLPTRDSTYCLGCHDGSTASDQTGLSMDFLSGRHPVGFNYADAYFDDPKGLRPVSYVEQYLDLPQGELHCQSCHDLAADYPELLAMSNHGSSLCLSCHVK